MSLTSVWERYHRARFATALQPIKFTSILIAKGEDLDRTARLLGLERYKDDDDVTFRGMIATYIRSALEVVEEQWDMMADKDRTDAIELCATVLAIERKTYESDRYLLARINDVIYV